MHQSSRLQKYQIFTSLDISHPYILQGWSEFQSLANQTGKIASLLKHFTYDKASNAIKCLQLIKHMDIPFLKNCNLIHASFSSIAPSIIAFFFFLAEGGLCVDEFWQCTSHNQIKENYISLMLKLILIFISCIVI